MGNTAQRNFDLSDILSVTTGALVSSRHMDGIYDIMGYVTGDEGISTIGLAMMADSAKKTILGQHPELEAVKFPGIKNVAEENRVSFINGWIAEQKERFGEKLSIIPASAPRAVSLEEQIGYVRERNPNVKVAVVEVPSEPRSRASGHKPNGKNFG